MKKRVIRLRSKERKVLNSVLFYVNKEKELKVNPIVGYWKSRTDYVSIIRNCLDQLERIVNNLREIGVPPLEEAAMYADQHSLEKIITS